MSTITSAFTGGRKAFIPYLMAGFPDRETFLSLVDAVFDSGADILEVGIPFSDPLADGPTIQYAAESALADGVTVASTIEMLSGCNREGKPVVIMSYLNPLLQYGPDRFLREASQCGVRGLIIPDIIVEEGAGIERACRANDVDLIYLLAPTSPPERQEMILRRSRGFVYLVSVAGVTGARNTLAGNLTDWISGVKTHSPLPVAVGFGISTPEHAAHIASASDGVVVGSAIIDIIRNSPNSREAIERTKQFAVDIRTALDRNTVDNNSPLPSRRT